MKYIFSLLILLAGAMAQAESVRHFFISEPGNVFVLIPQGVRAAMITMAEEGQKIASKNTDNGTVQIDSLSESFISVHCSDAKQVEIKMLTKEKADTVLAVVETMRLPAMDSKISFYNTRWLPVAPNKCIKGEMPDMRHFIKPGTPAHIVEMIERTIPFPLIWLTFGQADGKLVAMHQLQTFLSKEDFNKIAPYLLDAISYDIINTKLKRSKP
ncbi:MAG: DUF3256 family protein [Sodaliphilus sp.]